MTSAEEPATNEDRDGVVVYRGDRVRIVDDATGATIRMGIVVGHPRDGWVHVRWAGDATDARVQCSGIVVGGSAG